MTKLNKIKSKKLNNYRLSQDYWKYLINTTDGFNEGELIVIGARPGVGKTSLSLELAILLSKYGNSVFESLEMPKEQIYHKASLFCNNIDKLENIYINDENRLTCEEIEKHIRKTNAKFVFVDYLQIMGGKIKQNTSELKKIALRNKCVVFLMSQLNRAADGKSPKLSSLRDSGTIEQDADQVWFIHNNYLIIAKNRKGKIGDIPITFNKEYSYFVENQDRIKINAVLMALCNKLLNTKTTIGYKIIENKIKKIDYNFYLKHIIGGEPLNYVALL